MWLLCDYYVIINHMRQYHTLCNGVTYVYTRQTAVLLTVHLRAARCALLTSATTPKLTTGLFTTYYLLLTTASALTAEDFRFRNIYSSSPLLIPHSALPTPHSSLLAPRSSLLSPHSSLLTPYSVLMNACYLFPTSYGLSTQIFTCIYEYSHIH